MQHYDVIIIGAGAAGLFCASQAGVRGLSVLVLDHANRVGKKILMSGGGRCNFTNLYVSPDDYQSENPHFVKSALNQYTQWDFISLVESHGIAYHEKSQGQLFCDGKASAIVQMLVTEAQKVRAEIRSHCQVLAIRLESSDFIVETSLGLYQCQSLVVATGGLSVPTIGASDFGYRIAKQFGHSIVSLKPGLVPFLWHQKHDRNSALSGVSCPVEVQCNGYSISDQILFTHRGLSGPAMLKISNYWDYGKALQINFLPNVDLELYLREQRQENPKRTVRKVLLPMVATQVIDWLLEQQVKPIGQMRLADLSNQAIADLSTAFQNWQWVPADTEGYRTAEVTLGGVSTDELSSKTMMSQRIKNLYFIGEVVDVTGQLGGFNFQWAWSSAYAAAQAINKKV